MNFVSKLRESMPSQKNLVYAKPYKLNDNQIRIDKTHRFHIDSHKNRRNIFKIVTRLERANILIFSE